MRAHVLADDVSVLLVSRVGFLYTPTGKGSCLSIETPHKRKSYRHTVIHEIFAEVVLVYEGYEVKLHSQSQQVSAISHQVMAQLFAFYIYTYTFWTYSQKTSHCADYFTLTCSSSASYFAIQLQCSLSVLGMKGQGGPKTEPYYCIFYHWRKYPHSFDYNQSWMDRIFPINLFMNTYSSIKYYSHLINSQKLEEQPNTKLVLNMLENKHTYVTYPYQIMLIVMFPLNLLILFAC